MAIEDQLKQLIDDGFSGTQKDFAKALAKRGMEVNQSSISRALKRIGAKKYGGSWQWESQVQPSLSGDVRDHVLSIANNEVMIVLRTPPGSANFVACILDRQNDPLILGIIAGDDTLFITPRRVTDMRSCTSRIKSILQL